MHQITLNDLIINVTRKKIKNLHLTVHPPDGEVRISAPLHLNDETIRLFAISKLHWIKKNQAKLKNQPRQNKKKFVTGETHYYQGKPYLLNVIYYIKTPKVEIRNNTYLDLYVKEGSEQNQREQTLINWYRQQLKSEIPAIIRKWEKIMQIEVKEWGVKKMKTRWGTCNIQAQRIWLNLELIKTPSHCLEYVIVHEMTHFFERHHNEKFRKLMDQFLPHWSIYKEELNQTPLEPIK
ncbi:SprT family zinc-dependent metalloprotease [Crocosphaera sp. XPORK-15E]|uniref:M48 family metallopeptidase n=1 Tax=Crocosphaera sp. XPORK-15E TaxID=3110247 RepID=UPI002B21C227|nr:SprT family zinc-dependent metalloprotease [Crocosphaera sp. XPORK-15E]MEA5533713.1 SprT family zinc-dependent metalloprotease [Crocosphaera sp. XPORK-15E]